MRTILHIAGTLAGGSIFATALLVALDQKLMIGPATLVTVIMVGLTAAIWALDKRIRRMLLDLCEELMELAFERDKALIYHDVGTLREEIVDGRSLLAASRKLGHLSGLLEADGQFPREPLL